MSSGSLNDDGSWVSARLRTLSCQWLVALAATCLAGFASAGQIYKSVGPDGKVTYSDQPPTTDSADLSKGMRERDPTLRLDPVKAALNVYAKEVVVESATRFCVRTVPGSASRVSAARDEWMQRHAALRAKKIMVLHDRFSTSELTALATKMEQTDEGILRTLALAPLDQQTKWCTEAPKTFAAPEFDLAGKPEVVDAIMSYRGNGQH